MIIKQTKQLKSNTRIIVKSEWLIINLQTKVEVVSLEFDCKSFYKYIHNYVNFKIIYVNKFWYLILLPIKKLILYAQISLLWISEIAQHFPD